MISDDKIANKLPIFAVWDDRKVYLTITVDSRRGIDENLCVNVVGRVTRDRQTVYLKLTTSKKYTLKEFREICKHEAIASCSCKRQRKELRDMCDNLKESISNLLDKGLFSFDNLRESYTGISKEKSTIYTVWSDVIKSKRVSTADAYNIALKRFIKDNGSRVSFSQINSDFISRWQIRMSIDLGITSIGIYLRTFRVILNEAKRKGYLDGDINFFHDTGINKSRSRKKEYLSVEIMAKLYDFFIKGDAKDIEGNEIYFPEYKKLLFKSLGQFLFLYLANGLNLADAARLRYDDYYFQTKVRQEPQMKFNRHKTKDRTDDESEVIFPIIPQIKEILKRIANKEHHNGLVFDILSERMTESQERRRIQQENSNIKNRVRAVCDYLEITEQPSPTWSRHSFATNLTMKGVSKDYISQSMGHSCKDVTSRYIDSYPYKDMVGNNSKLITDGNKDDIVKKLAALDRDTLERLLTKINQ